MNNMQRQVQQWNEAFGVPVAQQPGMINEERRRLRLELIREEFEDELCPAMERGDLVDTADALTDLLYVVYGAAVELGLDMEPLFNEVQRSNMSKLMPDGSVLRRFDGKIMKGPNYTPPNLAVLIDDQLRQQNLPL